MSSSLSPLRVLLVDDEYLALNLLEEFLSQVPNTDLVGKCKSAIEAMTILTQQSVDVMFLDIQMPTLSGVDFLKGLQSPPATIFTTAYRDYAVEAFELRATDYLVKPFSFARFAQALQRAQEEAQRSSDSPNSSEFLHLKVDGKIIRVRTSDIVYVEGMKEYVRVVCTDQKLVTFERLKNMESMLPRGAFTRVHKSYIIANDAIRAIEGNLLDLGLAKVPVSRTLRADIIRDLFS